MSEYRNAMKSARRAFLVLAAAVALLLILNRSQWMGGDAPIVETSPSVEVAPDHRFQRGITLTWEEAERLLNENDGIVEHLKRRGVNHVHLLVSAWLPSPTSTRTEYRNGYYDNLGNVIDTCVKNGVGVTVIPALANYRGELHDSLAITGEDALSTFLLHYKRFLLAVIEEANEGKASGVILNPLMKWPRFPAGQWIDFITEVKNAVGKGRLGYYVSSRAAAESFQPWEPFAFATLGVKNAKYGALRDALDEAVAINNITGRKTLALLFRTPMRVRSGQFHFPQTSPEYANPQPASMDTADALNVKRLESLRGVSYTVSDYLPSLIYGSEPILPDNAVWLFQRIQSIDDSIRIANKPPLLSPFPPGYKPK